MSFRKGSTKHYHQKLKRAWLAAEKKRRIKKNRHVREVVDRLLGNTITFENGDTYRQVDQDHWEFING